MPKKLLLLCILIFVGATLCSCSARPAAPPPDTSPPARENKALSTPVPEVSIKFAVFGDSKMLPGRPRWQGNVVLSEIVDSINQESPDLVIYLGDGPDRGGPIENMQAFRSALEKLKPPWHPAPGNHETADGAGPDGKRGDGEENFIAVFGDRLPLSDGTGRKVSYYSFDYRDSHFVVLDTAWQSKKDNAKYGLFPGSPQWQWLVQDLEKARPKSRHIFIFGHQPPVNPYNPEYSWANRGAAESFSGICRQYKVDAVFSGHYHAYGSFEDRGTRHIITGGGGAGLYAAPESGGFFHYVLCSVTGDNVIYRVMKMAGAAPLH